MSLARESLILLVLLLPGFLFFIGLYAPEQFSREMTPRGSVFDIAAVTIAAFSSYCLVAAGWWVLSLHPWATFEGPGVGQAVTVLREFTRVVSSSVASDFGTANAYALHMLAIVVLASVTGFGLGITAGRSLPSDRYSLRRLVRHSWVYDLVLGLTDVFVLTNIQSDTGAIVYKGELADFGLQSDGSFSYIVIAGCCRGMLSVTSMHAEIEWHPIGSSHGPDLEAILSVRGSGFMIRGSDIANVVFERRLDFREGMEQAIKAAEAARVEVESEVPEPQVHA